MPSELKYENKKVSQNHLSALMRFILLKADGGIRRGEITEKFYGLERRYCGHYTDPCLRGKEKILYDCRYRRAQPAISKVLIRLEKQGLVQLVRHGKYVKEVCLIEKGNLTTQKLNQVGIDNQGK